MADVENKDVSDSLGVTTHKEGTDLIKDKLAGKVDEPTTAPEGTAEAVEPAPETTVKPEPIVPAQPPASNPGSSDASAGIAKDAGGVSSAAYVQSPTATKEKRKSIFGPLTGFLGLGGKKEKEVKTASQDNGEAPDPTATAAARAAVLADRTKSTVQENTGIDVGAKGKETAVDGAAEGAAEPTAAVEETPTKDIEDSAKEPTGTSGESTDGPLVPAVPGAAENRAAIPIAGGEKLGEKHWGESKIVPENPKPVDEDIGVASKDGQPSKDVSDNTAKNTGGATGGPSGSKSPQGGEKKEKLVDKIKNKFSKNKA